MRKNRHTWFIRATLAGLYVAGLCGTAAAADPPTPIHYVYIERARDDMPRADVASVVELKPGHFLMVYHRYRMSKKGGSDFGPCSIWMQESTDDGLSWSGAHEIIPMRKGDNNVQSPAICRLPSGELLLLANRGHSRASTSMELHRSQDNGKTWQFDQAIWSKSRGQWLQGGASQLLQTQSGRLILPAHGGKGDQAKQKNDAWTTMSDDEGKTWHRSKHKIKLPMRGAMEASIAELSDGELVLSLRTQLGGPFISRSKDKGETWSSPQPSGLIGPESCTCLRTLPGTDSLILFWNNSRYEQGHHHFGERSPLSVAVSNDRGHSWKKIGDLEIDPKVEYSDLSCTFTRSGKAIVTYFERFPAWSRSGISLKCAVVPIEWFTKNEF